jgi:hypothetical protein
MRQTDENLEYCAALCGTVVQDGLQHCEFLVVGQQGSNRHADWGDGRRGLRPGTNCA